MTMVLVMLHFGCNCMRDMRQAGFFIKTVEDSCENFAVIDQEIIWYGNIHLLGKEKVEDNIMRGKDKKIAAELLELAFK